MYSKNVGRPIVVNLIPPNVYHIERLPLCTTVRVLQSVSHLSICGSWDSFTDRISDGGNAIASVRLPVCLFKL